MRKMMLVASLVSAACGSVEEPGAIDGSGSDMGSDMGTDAGVSMGSGSGSGSGSGVPTETGELTIDSSDYVVQGGTWWTATSGPTLRGTFQGPSGSAVAIKIGGNTYAATLSASAWSVSLPANTITSSNVPIIAALTIPNGDDVELSRTLGLDSAPPAISAKGTIRDERMDSIDFSTGEPIHTHQGASIDLGAATCPSVYKYAYLMDASPAFGSSTSQNDLAWKILVSDAKLQNGSQQFRVRTDAGTVLVNWTALPAPDAAGYSTVQLTRNGGAYPIAALGTRTGQFFIDVRATDWGGLSSTSSFCFDHHPLAAPLKVSAFEQGSLFQITTSDDAAVTAMMQWGQSVQVTKQRVTQQTAEPITMTWSATGVSPAFTAKKVAGWIEEFTSGGSIICNAGNTNPWCVMAETPRYMKGRELSSSGTLQYAKYSVSVRDDVSGEIIASSTTPSVTVTLPPRGASEAPHSYSFEVSMTNYSELFPEHNYFTETTTNTLMGLTYTGEVPVKLNYGCAKMTSSAFGPWCSEQVTYWTYTAIDQATLSFSPFVATIATGPDAQHLSAASYVPASTLTSAAFAWDSGDDDLPGPF